MRLKPLCTLELAYREESLYQGKFVVARPYDSKEASAYGEGDGWVKGEKLQGTLRWVNRPHCRTDGVWLPNLHGVIQTEDGASILFSLQGRTKFMADGKGHQLLTTIFDSTHECVYFPSAHLGLTGELIKIAGGGQKDSLSQLK